MFDVDDVGGIGRREEVAGWPNAEQVDVNA